MRAILVALAALALAAVSAAPAATTPCNGKLDPGVLPAWARGGFSEPRPRLTHTIGRKGEIAALVFAPPLSAPPARDRNNKILWVERRPSVTPTALWIHAQRMNGARPVGAPVTRIVRGAPGPSLVNLPVAGCWRLTLSWAGKHDTLDLRYTTPAQG